MLKNIEFDVIQQVIAEDNCSLTIEDGERRSGDPAVLVDINKAQNLLGYQPTHRIGEGLIVAMEWYVQNTKK